MNKKVILTITVIAIVGFFTWLITSQSNQSNTNSTGQAAKGEQKKLSRIQDEKTIEEADGIQIINITAKSGYYPNKIVAKANLASKIRITTDGTYDCSSSISIPGIKANKRLPASGVTEFDIPAKPSNSDLLVTCSMGMYRSVISFK